MFFWYYLQSYIRDIVEDYLYKLGKRFLGGVNAMDHTGMWLADIQADYGCQDTQSRATYPTV
jgi:hypothetical protein